MLLLAVERLWLPPSFGLLGCTARALPPADIVVAALQQIRGAQARSAAALRVAAADKTTVVLAKLLRRWGGPPRHV